MRDDRPHRKALKALLLGLLLVCAQSLAQAHEVVHNPAGEPELCTTCTIGGGLNAAPAHATETVYPIPTGTTPAVKSVCLGTAHVDATPEARGPPKHS